MKFVPYGGKDTLKNTSLLQVVLSKFDKVFVTYDLDAHSEAQTALKRLGLQEGKDFLPLGMQTPGKECVEGLLPHAVLSAVNGRETDLVMKLTSSERRNAKDQLKKLYLEEFKSRTDYSLEDLKHFSKAIKTINRQLA